MNAFLEFQASLTIVLCMNALQDIIQKLIIILKLKKLKIFVFYVRIRAKNV